MSVEYIWSDKKWHSEGSGLQWIGNGTCAELTFENIEIRIHDLYGSFALVLENEQELLLAVDLISSYPLFYGSVNDTIYISDDGSLIAEKLDAGLSEDNILEFLKTSYVTETETLFRNVYTLNPGTIVRINKQKGSVEEKHWFNLDYKQSSEKPVGQLTSEFDSCLQNVFKDLINRLAGKTALIPLSGGCDSRTVAVYLKKLNYQNVVCFSYGRKDSWEAERSKKIAEYLGFPWYFTEYNAESWRSLFSSKDYELFLRFSCRGRSIGCLQALPAVLNIRNQGVVPDDSVVVPGHTLDVTMGSHLSEGMNHWKKKKLIDKILADHYCLRDSQIENGSIEKWTQLIPAEITGYEIINLYMNWEYRNRQAKFIANDVRAYEYAGYDYELPFWDKRVQQFVMDLPYELLSQRKFQYLFTKQVVDPIAGIDLDYPVASSFTANVKQMIKKLPFAKDVVRHFRKTNQKDSDVNAAFSWLTDEEYKRLQSKMGTRFNINSIEADDYIKLLKRSFSVKDF